MDWSQIVLGFGQSVFNWINPSSTWIQFQSLMGRLMWMVPEMLICDFPTFIIMMIHGKRWKEIPFLKKKEKLAEAIFGALFLFYFQLPLLIESWPNIGDWCLIILIVANTGTAYFAYYIKQDSDNNAGICMISLSLLYLYPLGLWLIPMICFQFGFWILIIYLDKDVFKTNYLQD
jgi:hypothetical protein